MAHRVGALDPLFRWLSYAGTDGVVWLAIAGAVALATRRRGPIVWVALADGAAQIVTPALQALFGRARPHVHALVAEPHSRSFPSGHTTSSVACALVLASFAPRLRVPLALLAAAIAFSRLYVGVHYPLDVVGGVALGALLGWATLASRRTTGKGGARGLLQRAAARRRSRPGPRAG